jgi:hypothetical protein
MAEFPDGATINAASVESGYRPIRARFYHQASS